MKGTLLQTAGFLVLALLLFFVHSRYVLPGAGNIDEFSLRFYYSFHLGISVLYMALLYLVSRIDTTFVGFVFLFLIVIKIALFFFIGHKWGIKLSKEAAPHILFPYFVGLFLELFFVIKLLNKSN